MVQTPFLKAVAVATLAVAAGAAQAFDQLVVFGDSLTDSGNNAAIIGAQPSQVITGNTYVPLYPYGGAYTNGNTWVTNFAAGLGLPGGAVAALAGGGNFAFGGARTTVDGTNGDGFPYSATTQVTRYLLTSPPITPDTLFVVAIGANDVRAAAETLAPDGSNLISVATAAAVDYATGIGNIVDGLQSAGAQHIVVWNAPDVGRTPFALSGGPLASAAATFLAGAMNTALDARLAGEAGVTTFRMFEAFTPVFMNPGAYGFTNTTDACGAASNGCDPSTAVFWDGIHPTAAAHQVIAQAMLQVVAVPEPATWLLWSVGIAALTRVRRRR